VAVDSGRILLFTPLPHPVVLFIPLRRDRYGFRFLMEVSVPPLSPFSSSSCGVIEGLRVSPWMPANVSFFLSLIVLGGKRSIPRPPRRGPFPHFLSQRDAEVTDFCWPAQEGILSLSCWFLAGIDPSLAFPPSSLSYLFFPLPPKKEATNMGVPPFARLKRAPLSLPLFSDNQGQVVFLLSKILILFFSSPPLPTFPEVVPAEEAETAS